MTHVASNHAVDPLGWIDEELARREQESGLRRLRPLTATVAGRVFPGGRRTWNFATNDYLGLAGDPRLAEAAARAARHYGWGAGASPLVSGWKEEHEALAVDIAHFEGTEAATLFPTGFAANVGAITSLVGRDDAVYLDRLNHACLIDGAKLSGAALRPYRHADADHLEHLLIRDRDRYRRRLIATDGVFSMDGDVAPLAEIVDLSERHETMLLVDEAHGTGVFGPDGRGAASSAGVADRIDVRVGTCSKALGSLGGFVAGSQRLIAWLQNQARTLIYSTAIPPAHAAATREALRIVEAEPWRRVDLHDRAMELRHALRAHGWEVPSSEGPIVPVIVGDSETALELAAWLEEQACLVPAIRPPTVPRGTARLRISLTYDHGPEALSALRDGLGRRGPTRPIESGSAPN